MSTFTLETCACENEGESLRVVTIVVNYHGIKIEFGPDHPESIIDCDIEEENGMYDQQPLDGDFYIIWTPTLIEFSMSHYSEGDKGALTVSFDATPELLDELHSILRQWKELF